MSFSIIIPSRNPDNVMELLKSIKAKDEQSISRVIIVDDDRTNAFNDYQLSGDYRFKVIAGIQPFVFARNINLGIAAACDDDVILLNDDTRLISDFGFGYLSSIANENPQYGIISAGITGAVGNTEQIAQPGTRLREAKHHTLVFVCVYLRRAVLNEMQSLEVPIRIASAKEQRENPGLVGHTTEDARTRWMDERFVNYGFCDDDMCERVRRLGLKLGIFDGCIVEHGVLESSYRGNHGNTGLSDLEPNRKRFIEKWGFAPGQAPQKMQLESGAAHRKVEW